jgi:hypothetical protein
MVFEFPDEEKAQQARHKLEGWKQAFRLDKKLQVKFDRGDEVGDQGVEEGKPEAAASSSKKGEKGKAKSKAKVEKGDGAASGPVKLLVRLYFSGHEKLSEQQWMDRIPGDEIFKKAHPKVVHEGQGGFDEVLKRFETLE